MARFPILRDMKQPHLAEVHADDDPIDIPIDNAFDTALDYFADHDPIVSKLAEMKARAVWANAWRVRWGEKLPMRYFARPSVKTVFKNSMITIRERLRIKKYVGVWYRPNMDSWMLDVVAAERETNGASNSSSILIPFGAVEHGMGEFVRVAPRGEHTLDRQLVFRPLNEHIAKHYAFGVFDSGAKFWPVKLAATIQGESKSRQHEVLNIETLTGYIRGLGAGMWSKTSECALRPVSAFTRLYEMSEIIKEVQDYQMNAAMASAFPMAFATANAIPEQPLDEITDDNLATAASLTEARRKGGQGKFSLPQAKSIITSISNALQTATGGQAVADPVSGASLQEISAKVNTVYAELAARYGRVNPVTLIRPIEDFVSIAQGREPRVDIDLADLRLTYEIAVCREMDVPHSFYRTEVATPRAGGGQPNLQLSETTMTETIREEQELYTRLFDWIYMLVFGALDRELARSMVAEVHQLSDTDDRRAEALQAIDYMAKMLNSDDSYAKLEFELLTVRSADSLKVLIEMQQLGVVSRQLVIRNAQNLFGHTLGNDASQYALTEDPRLAPKVNPPLLPPVPPETTAKLDSSERVAKQKRADDDKHKAEPAKKKQKKDV